MTKRRRNDGSIGKRVLGTVALVLSILGFLGTFGVTGPGRAVAAYFSGLFGHLAWIGPYLLFALAVYLWFSPGRRRGKRRAKPSGRGPGTKKPGQRQERRDRGLAETDRPLPEYEGTLFSESPSSDKRAPETRGTVGNHGANRRAQQKQAGCNGTDAHPRQRNHKAKTDAHPRQKEGFWARRKGKPRKTREPQGRLAGNKGENSVGLPLPPTKLTTLKGFNRYFREDWQEFTPPGPENYPELGRNFPTYFGEGEAAGKPTPVIKSLHGLRAYFREVGNETAAKTEARVHPGTQEVRPQIQAEKDQPVRAGAQQRIQARRQPEPRLGTASGIPTTVKMEVPPEKHPDPLPQGSDPVKMTPVAEDGDGAGGRGVRILLARERQEGEDANDPPVAGGPVPEISATAEGIPDQEARLFLEAGRLFLKSGMASVTFLQRRLQLEYARAAEIMDKLEEEGIVGPYEGSKPRRLLVSPAEFEERYGQRQ
ncbi:FtsK gamma domain protein [Acididesulfobacillus acetoxydans]|uniref:FtsK gamma domain protein n=1 Tax=Acididesulfobacillus acetoxydans TaxID=1561005 RepID=A0A8S0X574_9FIRM|nr:FtsK gamma domain protein [Acididesulfobacillus acetoxydans]CEJ08851.1 MarR-type HTH domain [Acididesulfobacillus acetoxydans]